MHKPWILVTGPGWDGLVQQLKDEGHVVRVYTNKKDWINETLPTYMPWIALLVHDPDMRLTNPFIWSHRPLATVELPPL